MGGDKTTVENTSSSETRERTDDQKRLDALNLQQAEATQPGQIQAQQSGLNLINQLLSGQDLPGFLSGLPGGISQEAIGTQASQLANRYGAGFQSLGLVDSGTAFKETSRGIANELLFPTEQFNIGNLNSLLSLALSGQAQVQNPIVASQGNLGSRLSQFGTTSGQSTTSSSQGGGMNPFLQAGLTAAGTAFGGPVGGALASGAGKMFGGN